MNSKAQELLKILELENVEGVKIIDTSDGFILELPDGCGDMALQKLAAAMEAANLAHAAHIRQVDEEDKKRMAEQEATRMGSVPAEKPSK